MDSENAWRIGKFILPRVSCRALYNVYNFQKKWCDMLQTEEQKKESKDSMTALETMSANPNFRKK